MRRTIALIAGMLVLGIGHSMEVKGLALGTRTSLQALSTKFGHADCPDPSAFDHMDAVLPDISGTRTLACHVPTSYLGFSGTATVYVDRSFVIKSLVFQIPQGQEEAAAAVLEKKYGAPTSRRGDPMQLFDVGDKNSLKTTTSTNPCTSWKQVEDANIMVCPGNATYTYVGRVTVNPADL